MKRYTHTQFPANKDIDLGSLSHEQRGIRIDPVEEMGEKRVCNKCSKEQPITNYYPRYYPGTRKVKNRRRTCKDCVLKAQGVVEIGKQRFADKILKKGFRRCSSCKTIKHLSEYPKNAKRYGGHDASCKDCHRDQFKVFQVDQRESIGDSYVKEWAKVNYGIREFDQATIDRLRNEIIDKRKPIHFLDGKEFSTHVDLAKYISNKYGLPEPGLLKRLHNGWSAEECIVSERKARAKAHIKGHIEVSDQVTGEVFLFESTRDDGLLKMFATKTINDALKSGEIINKRITKLNKYPNPVIIKRIPLT